MSAARDRGPGLTREIPLNAVLHALRDFLVIRPPEVPCAVVGGIAVSVRTEPRFTRDLDLAVA